MNKLKKKEQKNSGEPQELISLSHKDWKHLINSPCLNGESKREKRGGERERQTQRQREIEISMPCLFNTFILSSG